MINLLHCTEIDLRYVPDNVDMAELIRSATGNGELGSAPSWLLFFGEDSVPSYERPGLHVGVREEVGAMAWEELPPLIPVNGSNTEETDYYLGGAHHSPISRYTELPIDQVLAAVAEFVRTGNRPTCIQWRPEAA